MVAPQNWSAPASGGTLTTSYGPNFVSYASGYWFALSRTDVVGTVELRYSNDPSGTWGTATLPSPPATYTATTGASNNAGVASDGTTWAYVAQSVNGGSTKWRINYATDPAGSWSAHEFDTSDLYSPSGLHYVNGQWVLVGRYLTSSPQPGFIATSGSANGTYTFYTSYTETGYDTAALTGGGTRFWNIASIAFDGSTYVTTADQNTGTSGVRYSSSLTSSWGTPTSPPSTSFTGAESVRYHSNGYWTISSDVAGSFWYTDTPSGTWSNVSNASLGTPSRFGEIAYGNGYWVMVGGYESAPLLDSPTVMYLASTTSPAGTYGSATGNGFAAPGSRDTVLSDIRYANGYFVASSDYNGELRYCELNRQTYLRQRQSPRATPQRVNRPTLRQRQTFR